MTNILWLCNVILPDIANEFNISTAASGGWLHSLSKQLKKDPNIDFAVCFANKNLAKIKKHGCLDGIKFWCFDAQNLSNSELFKKIIDEFTPDVIHIFGTEMHHSYEMINLCEKNGIVDRTVISIQGLKSICAKHYYAGLPQLVINSFSLRDFLRFDNIRRQQKIFYKQGLEEISTLSKAIHIIGRTDWDEACVKRINPNIKYHFCNETLRPAFYNHQWNFEKCEKHSIFVSQCNYPIIGFHLMLEAMVDIVKRYPNAHLYTTGLNPLKVSFKQKLTQTYYQKYIGKLIKKYHLEDYVTFLGYLDEHQMCDRFLKSHVFVSCSSIENSPNSVGEAMLLGTPVVSSDVGGVKNMLTHNKEGFIYPYDEPYMIAYYISRYFEDSSLCEKMSQATRTHAQVTHDIKLNYEKLLTIYNNIVNSIV